VGQGHASVPLAHGNSIPIPSGCAPSGTKGQKEQWRSSFAGRSPSSRGRSLTERMQRILLDCAV
jgi:hypothetical protein